LNRRSFQPFQPFEQPAIRFSFFLLATLTLLIVGLACSSSDEEPTVTVVSPTGVVVETVAPVSTSTPEATAEATPEVTPDVTPEVTPEVMASVGVTAGLAEIELSELASSTCVFGSVSAGHGLGTAPPPTVMPGTAGDSSGNGDAALRAEYLARAFSIADNLAVWSARFEESWGLELSPQQQAAALMLVEIKTSQLCEAITLLVPPDSLNIDHAYMQDVAAARHAWIVLAIGELAGSGTARSDSLGAGRISTHDSIMQNRTGLQYLEAENNESVSAIDFEQLGVQLSLFPRWYVYGSGRAPAISIPAELMTDLAALDPFAWETGAAVRIRRFAGFGSTSTAALLEQFDGLINSFGDPVGQTSGTVLGSEAVVTSVVDAEHDWDFTIVIAVVDKNAYVIDYGCPRSNPEWCVELSGVVSSLTTLAAG
jgi:hypothetical protein